MSSPTRAECLPDGPSNKPPGSATIHLWSKALVNASRTIWFVIVACACGLRVARGLVGSLRRQREGSRGVIVSLRRLREGGPRETIAAMALARARLRCPHGRTAIDVDTGTGMNFCVPSRDFVAPIDQRRVALLGRGHLKSKELQQKSSLTTAQRSAKRIGRVLAWTATG